MSTTLTPKLPQLTGANYYSWKNDILIALAGINARRLVTGEEVPPTNNAVTQLRDFTERSEKAVCMLQNACGLEARSYIHGLFDPVQIWTTLRERFASDAAAQPNRLQLTMKFSTSRIKPNQPIGEWIAELRRIQSELAHSPAAINDHQIISHILTHMPQRYKQLKMMISHSKDPAVQTLDNIAHEFQLFDAEERLQNQLSGNLSTSSTLEKANALLADAPSSNQHGRGGYRGNRRGRGNYRGQGRGGGNRQHPYNNQGRSASSNTECYYCTKKGHFSYDCEIRIAADKRYQEREAEKARANVAIATTDSNWTTEELNDNEGTSFYSSAAF